MQLTQRVLMLLVMMIANVDAATVSGFIAPVYCNASAPLNLNGAGGIDILFVNGIDNTPEDAIQTAGSIMTKIIRPIKDQYPQGIRVGNIYNPAGSDSFAASADSLELRAQANAEAEAQRRTDAQIKQLTDKYPALLSTNQKSIFMGIKRAILQKNIREVNIEWFLQKFRWGGAKQDGSVENAAGDGRKSEFIGPVIMKIVAALEERLLTGRRVVIVAHSQGNHFIEAAYAILQKRMTPEQLAGLQVVGVAVVASTTPHNRWVTIAQDRAVYVAYPALTVGVGSPLGDSNSPKGNFDAVANKNGGWGTSEPSDWNVTTWDTNRHNMINIYLNDQIFRKGDHSMTLLAEVARLVKDGVDNTIAPAQVVTAGSLTATLTWINQTDLDLHIIEVFNDGSSDTHVSYRNKQGRSGKLDRDDTSGPGPEHYYANVNDSSGNLCAALHGKTFRFSVNPYRILNIEEPTVLNLRIGNTIYSKSLLLTNADRTIDRLPTKEASFADVSVAGRAIFDVTFDYANGYRVVDY